MTARSSSPVKGRSPARNGHEIARPVDWRRSTESRAFWRLKGEAILRAQPVAPGALGPSPADLRMVHVAPGRTIGCLYLARYGEGSTLRYHELLVLPELVRKGAHLGFRVSHAYVDNPVSAAGGQEIWGLPKRLARFQWTAGERHLYVAVEDESGVLCRVLVPIARHPVILPLRAPVWSSRGARRFRFVARGSVWAALTRGEVSVPESSPFAALGLRDGPTLQFRELDVQVPVD